MEYSDRAQQDSYGDGFVDGQLDIIDYVLELVDDYGNWSDALGEIQVWITEKKKEIDSL